ncbi:MAG: Rrf2 family transcriptional regulator [Candidatus Omnitrophota bacterium]|nr:Rrf2 family transcriptional regulator [Candidatus Omnitrophota bacterium]
MISKRTKYALHALIYLAQKHDKGIVLIDEIAKSQKMPKKFLETILLDLKNHGFLLSKRGKGGGYRLARDPKQIMMGSIIRIVEGPLAPVSCVSQTAYQKCHECRDEASCGIRMIMKEVREAIAKILDNTSLEDTITRSKSKEALEYFI